MQFTREFSGNPNSSTKIRRAYGPATLLNSKKGGNEEIKREKKRREMLYKVKTQ